MRRRGWREKRMNRKREPLLPLSGRRAYARLMQRDARSGP